MVEKICLIDADSKIPNIALMKLSSFYKKNGSIVELYRANIPYYPSRKKKQFIVPSGFDKYFCSVVFMGNAEYIIGKDIEFGGSGYSIDKNLTGEIEQCQPDYSIYPDNDTSYGFLSRGCIRSCGFCIVPKKEGKIHQVASIDDIVKHKKVKFLDNNFLALSNHKELLDELAIRKIRCQFNQGLDIRLIDNDNSKLLSRLNYLGEYIFAFDSYSYINIIESKLSILNWRKPYQFKFFVYSNPNMELSDIVRRIEHLRSKQCLPYIMRDISCWDSEYKDFYTDIASWCNQPNLFKKMSFDDFIYKRHINNTKRAKNSQYLYRSSI